MGFVMKPSYLISYLSWLQHLKLSIISSWDSAHWTTWWNIFIFFLKFFSYFPHFFIWFPLPYICPFDFIAKVFFFFFNSKLLVPNHFENLLKAKVMPGKGTNVMFFTYNVRNFYQFLNVHLWDLLHSFFQVFTFTLFFLRMTYMLSTLCQYL